MKSRYIAFHLKEKTWEGAPELEVFNLQFPPWLCQPYVRPPPDEHLKKLEEIKEKQKEERKRASDTDEDPNRLSKRKMKKMERNPHKTFSKNRENCPLCENCPNPRGTKCGRNLCRQCCKNKCFVEELDCIGHKVFVKTNREKARKHSMENQEQTC